MKCHHCNDHIELGLNPHEEANLKEELDGKAVLICIECWDKLNPNVKQVLPPPAGM